MPTPEDLLKTAAFNMCWMADRVHQAHHPSATPADPGTWKICHKGICASMEYMLGQAGYDKDLKPVPVLP